MNNERHVRDAPLPFLKSGAFIRWQGKLVIQLVYDHSHVIRGDTGNVCISKLKMRLFSIDILTMLLNRNTTKQNLDINR